MHKRGKMKNLQKINNNFYKNIKDILQKDRENIYTKVNFIMVEAY